MLESFTFKTQMMIFKIFLSVFSHPAVMHGSGSRRGGRYAVEAMKGKMRKKSLYSSSSLRQITFREEHCKKEDIESEFLKMICDYITTGKFIYSQFADPILDHYIYFFFLLKPSILPSSSSLSDDDLVSYSLRK